MKSEIVSAADVPSSYPRLRVARPDQGGMVVLFTSARTGTVVHLGQSNAYNLGHYSPEWSLDAFMSFHGAVTLSND